MHLLLALFFVLFLSGVLVVWRRAAAEQKAHDQRVKDLAELKTTIFLKLHSLNSVGDLAISSADPGKRFYAERLCFHRQKAQELMDRLRQRQELLSESQQTELMLIARDHTQLALDVYLDPLIGTTKYHPLVALLDVYCIENALLQSAALPLTQRLLIEMGGDATKAIQRCPSDTAHSVQVAVIAQARGCFELLKYLRREEKPPLPRPGGTDFRWAQQIVKLGELMDTLQGRTELALALNTIKALLRFTPSRCLHNPKGDPFLDIDEAFENFDRLRFRHQLTEQTSAPQESTEVSGWL